MMTKMERSTAWTVTATRRRNARWAAWYSPPFEDCTNGVDDDYDGEIDCADSDCDEAPECQMDGMGPLPFEECNNGVDDDLDGAIDCADSDCDEAPECQMAGGEPVPFEDCDNGVDDDYDGAIDCADSDCDEAPECQMGERHQMLSRTAATGWTTTTTGRSIVKTRTVRPSAGNHSQEAINTLPFGASE